MASKGLMHLLVLQGRMLSGTVGLTHSLCATSKIRWQECIGVKQGGAPFRSRTGFKTISSTSSAGAVISSLRKQTCVNTSSLVSFDYMLLSLPCANTKLS